MIDGFHGIAVRLGRQSFAYALASIVGPGTGLLLLPVYTRYLAPADFGVIAMLEVVALVLTAIFSLGMPALVPFLYIDERSVEERRRALGTLLVAVTAVNVVLGTIVWVTGQAVLSWAMPSVPFHPFVPLVILTAVIEPYWVMAAATLQIQERAGRLAMWSIVRAAVSVGARVLLVVVLTAGAVGFVTANLITAVAFAAVAAWVLRRDMTPAFSPGIVREALQVGGPTVPNNLLSYGFRLIDRIVLERFGTLESVGIYYVALRLGDIMRLAADVLVNAWRPVFLKEADDPVFAQRHVPRVIGLTGTLLITLCVGLSVFSAEAVSLLAAPSYMSAATLVPLLAAAMTLKGLQSFPYQVIWLRKKTWWVPVLSALTLLVAVAANWFLAARWGATGVALALVISYAFLSVAMLVVAKRLYTLVYPWRTLGTATALGVVTVALAASVGTGLVAEVSKAGLMIAYGVSVVVTGCVPWKDVRALSSAQSALALERGGATVP